jgi:HEAT repeat protein
MAAYCLRDLGVRSPAIETALLAALHDTEAGVRLAAMSSLARLSATHALLVPHVADLLTDPDPGVQRAAAVVLGTLGESSTAALTALRQAAASPDASLRRAAERSLHRLHA